MKITGIAPGLSHLYEDNRPAFEELVYLATQALQVYHPTGLITSLYPGWDQALAKAAVNLGIPVHVALPYPQREQFLRLSFPDLYKDLLPKARHIESVSKTQHKDADLECHRWRLSRADTILALWDYEFSGETFQVIDAGLKARKQVVNLWEDWSRLYSLRKELDAVYRSQPARGAQIFTQKSE